MGLSICFFSALFYPNVGGVENYTRHVAQALLARGHAVTVVTCNVHSAPAQEELDGIQVLRLPCHALLNGRYPTIRHRRGCQDVFSRLDRERFDLIVIQTRFYTLSLKAARYARRRQIPCICIDHGSAHLTLANPVIDRIGSWYEHGITRLLRHDCHDFYGVSHASLRWLGHFHIAPRDVLYNSVDYEAIDLLASRAKPHFRQDLGLGPDTALIVFTGRIVEEKGVRSLTAAAEQLAAEENVHFLLAGGGPLLEELKAASGPHCTFLGALPFDEVVCLLTEADIFCLPSRSEGFCTSFLEAVACQCFCVCTKVGGVEEVILSDHDGVLLPDASPASVREGLRAALHRVDRQAVCARLSSRCRTDFTFAATAQAIETIAQHNGNP